MSLKFIKDYLISSLLLLNNKMDTSIIIDDDYINNIKISVYKNNKAVEFLNNNSIEGLKSGINYNKINFNKHLLSEVIFNKDYWDWLFEDIENLIAFLNDVTDYSDMLKILVRHDGHVIDFDNEKVNVNIISYIISAAVYHIRNNPDDCRLNNSIVKFLEECNKHDYSSIYDVDYRRKKMYKMIIKCKFNVFEMDNIARRYPDVKMYKKITDNDYKQVVKFYRQLYFHMNNKIHNMYKGYTVFENEINRDIRLYYLNKMGDNHYISTAMDNKEFQDKISYINNILQKNKLTINDVNTDLFIKLLTNQIKDDDFSLRQLCIYMQIPIYQTEEQHVYLLENISLESYIFLEFKKFEINNATIKDYDIFMCNDEIINYFYNKNKRRFIVAYNNFNKNHTNIYTNPLVKNLIDKHNVNDFINN